MLIVFDVFVDGHKKETLQPATSRIQDLLSFIQAQSESLVQKYGSNVYITRRIIYR